MSWSRISGWEGGIAGWDSPISWHFSVVGMFLKLDYIKRLRTEILLTMDQTAWKYPDPAALIYFSSDFDFIDDFQKLLFLSNKTNKSLNSGKDWKVSSLLKEKFKQDSNCVSYVENPTLNLKMKMVTFQCCYMVSIKLNTHTWMPQTCKWLT